jgi:hypothetical protein
MSEAIQLLKEASSHINHLRQQNEFMGARLKMFDDVMASVCLPILLGK